MKSLFAFVLSFVAVSVAFANTVESVYKIDSMLPSQLKQLIITEVTRKCPDSITPYGLNEMQTVVQSGSFEGEAYSFYTTQFDSRYYFDGMHPSHTVLTVYSEQRGADKFSVGRMVSDICEQ